METPPAPGLRAVPPGFPEPSAPEHQGSVGERVAGGEATDRDDEETVVVAWEATAETPTEDDLRLRAEAASDELRRRAEELREEASRSQGRSPGEPAWREPSRELPDARSLAVEIVIAGVRLAGTLATAPFRLAWALLRSRPLT